MHLGYVGQDSSDGQSVLTTVFQDIGSVFKGITSATQPGYPNYTYPTYNPATGAPYPVTGGSSSLSSMLPLLLIGGLLFMLKGKGRKS